MLANAGLIINSVLVDKTPLARLDDCERSIDYCKWRYSPPCLCSCGRFCANAKAMLTRTLHVLAHKGHPSRRNACHFLYTLSCRCLTKSHGFSEFTNVRKLLEIPRFHSDSSLNYKRVYTKRLRISVSYLARRGSAGKRCPAIQRMRCLDASSASRVETPID